MAHGSKRTVTMSSRHAPCLRCDAPPIESSARLVSYIAPSIQRDTPFSPLHLRCSQRTACRPEGTGRSDPCITPSVSYHAPRVASHAPHISNTVRSDLDEAHGAT